jgi:demethoxyubiquinone hydroxylase (CLK1/Coq7/Cat5 family)
MTGHNIPPELRTDYDTSVIRPILIVSQIQHRGIGLSVEKLKKNKKILQKLHTLELMATTIYRFQITKEQNELNRQFIAAMCNEMTHYQDFTILLYEFGCKPSLLRWAFWFAGAVMGYISRRKGQQTMLKLDIWIETLAANDYERILEKAECDDYCRGIIEKNQADEFVHIDRWKAFLAQNSESRTR